MLDSSVAELNKYSLFIFGDTLLYVLSLFTFMVWKCDHLWSPHVLLSFVTGVHRYKESMLYFMLVLWPGRDASTRNKVFGKYRRVDERKQDGRVLSIVAQHRQVQ